MVLRGERLNGLSHLVGTLLAIAGLVALVVVTAARHDPRCTVASALFGASLVLLYLSSTAYHSAWGRPKRILQKVDHAAIYVLIAGTYTPYTLIALHGAWGWTLFGLSWGLAAVGIVQELVFTGRASRRVSLALYLTMGWLIVIAIGPLSARLGSSGVAWLLAGGVTYTVGVIFYVAEGRLRHAHGIWHLFVLGGSTFHYFGVLMTVV